MGAGRFVSFLKRPKKDRTPCRRTGKKHGDYYESNSPDGWMDEVFLDVTTFLDDGCNCNIFIYRYNILICSHNIMSCLQNPSEYCHRCISHLPRNYMVID